MYIANGHSCIYMYPAQSNEIILILHIKQFFFTECFTRVRLPLLLGHYDVRDPQIVVGLYLVFGKVSKRRRRRQKEKSRERREDEGERGNGGEMGGERKEGVEREERRGKKENYKRESHREMEEKHYEGDTK